MRLASLVSAALCGTLFVACGSDPADTAATEGSADTGFADVGSDGSVDTSAVLCVSSTDCAGGEICAGGICVEACTSSDECTGALRICDPATALCVACTTAAHCGAGSFACIENTCVQVCTTSADCTGGRVCDVETQRCVDPECTDDADCPGGSRCRDGACAPIVEPVCESRSTECDGNTLVTCAADGLSQTREECEDGLCVDDGTSASCVPVICEPDEIGCLDDATAWLCNSTGTEQEPLPCPGGTFCTDGVCEARACEPGTTICRDDALVTCSEDAEFGEAVACDSTPECADTTLGCTCVDGGCVERICTPGESTCVGTGFRTCADDGLSFSTVTPCDDGFTCIAGACIGDECTPGERTCAGNTVLACNESGSATSVAEVCSDGETCVDGACEASCDGAATGAGCVFYAVDLDQFSDPCSTALDCASGDTCEDGACRSTDSRRLPFGVRVANPAFSPVTVTARNTAGDVVATVTVPGLADGVLNLPSSNVNNTSLTASGIRIESPTPIFAWQFNSSTTTNSFSNDSSTLLPAASVGREYVVSGWPMVDSDSFRTYVGIIAVEDGTTTVTVTPRTTIDPGPGGTPEGAAVGATRTWRLSRGQVLSLSSAVGEGLDLTGSIIQSSANISVFWGSECSNVPLEAGFCDHMEEQLLPTSTWGTTYVGATFDRRGTEPTIWRVVAATDNTLITTTPAITDVHNRRINRGAFLEFTTTQNFVLNASSPVAVTQYMVGSAYPSAPGGNCSSTFFGRTGCAIPGDICESGSGIGDPAFTVLAPNSRFVRTHTVSVPSGYREDYLNIVAPTGTDVTLDGFALPVADATVGSYSIWRRAVADGFHEVDADAAVGVIVYGYECDTSYAHPGNISFALP